MLETSLVKVIGRGSTVNLTIDDIEDISVVSQHLHDHLVTNRFMYSTGIINVNVGQRILVKDEIHKIKEIIESESDVTVARFWCDPFVLSEALSERNGFGVDLSDPSRKLQPQQAIVIQHNDPATYFDTISHIENDEIDLVDDSSVDTDSSESDLPDTPEYLDGLIKATGYSDGELHYDTEYVSSDISEIMEDDEEKLDDLVGFPIRDEAEPVEVKSSNKTEELIDAYRRNEALFIKTTCRSGEVIKYPGDIVVLADVNPGAQLVADGDIIIFGNLRGFAHAGASGDTQSVIVASNLNSHRIQISDCGGVSPEKSKQNKSRGSKPKIAFIRRNSIYVTTYTGRFSGYSGGVLYEG